MPDYSKPFKSLGYDHYLGGYRISHKTGGAHKVYDPAGKFIAMNFVKGKVGK